jgi:hypothetical protein
MFLPAILAKRQSLEITGDYKRAVLIDEAIKRRASRSTVEPQNSGGIGRVSLRLHKPVVEAGVGNVQVTRILLGRELTSPTRKR